MAQKAFRITYATMSADSEALHAAYEKGIQTAKSWLGQKQPFYVNGEAREGETYDQERSPIDRDIDIGCFARAGVRDVNDAVAAARACCVELTGPAEPQRPSELRASSSPTGTCSRPTSGRRPSASARQWRRRSQVKLSTSLR